MVFKLKMEVYWNSGGVGGASGGRLELHSIGAMWIEVAWGTWWD